MRDFSTKEVSAWGGILVGEELLAARLYRGKGGPQGRAGLTGVCHFECLRVRVVAGAVPLPQETVTSEVATPVPRQTGGQPAVELTQKGPWVVGVSAVGMALRRMRLPFRRSEQIRAVLPQEAADILVERLERPCFSFHAVPDPGGEASHVFFAVCETKWLTDLLESLGGVGVQPVGVVVAELGVWPLLEWAGLVDKRGSVLVVDASLDPPAILHLLDGQLHALRLVAPATVAAGEEAVQEELQWLLAAIVARLPQRANGQQGEVVTAPASVVGEVILLGRSPAFWQPFLDDPPWQFPVALQAEASTGCTVRLPVLTDLGLGLGGWEWLRPAGLALAAQQGPARLLDFRGVGGLQSLLREWLIFWRTTGILLVILIVVWGSMTGLRYYWAQARQQHFTSATAALFKKVLPRVPVMLDPRLQMRQALTQALPEGTQTLKMVEWLRLLQTRVDAESEVQWLRFRYEPGEVQLLGEVPSYEQLDRVQKTLKALSVVREVRTEEAHIVTKTNKVQFRLRLL